MAIREHTRWFAFLLGIVLIGVSALSIDAYFRAQHARHLAALEPRSVIFDGR